MMHDPFFLFWIWRREVSEKKKNDSNSWRNPSYQSSNQIKNGDSTFLSRNLHFLHCDALKEIQPKCRLACNFFVVSGRRPFGNMEHVGIFWMIISSLADQSLRFSHSISFFYPVRLTSLLLSQVERESALSHARFRISFLPQIQLDLLSTIFDAFNTYDTFPRLTDLRLYFSLGNLVWFCSV